MSEGEIKKCRGFWKWVYNTISSSFRGVVMLPFGQKVALVGVFCGLVSWAFLMYFNSIGALWYYSLPLVVSIVVCMFMIIYGYWRDVYCETDPDGMPDRKRGEL
jgi:hypothetical protein